MGINIRVSGVWRDSVPYVRIGNLWRSPKKAYVRVSGVWREVYTLSAPPIWTMTQTGFSQAEDDDPFVRIDLGSDGLIYTEANDQDLSSMGQWLPSGGDASDYRVKWDRVSGSSSLVGSTTTGEGVWHTLNSSFSTSYENNNNGSTSSINILYTIENISTGESVTASISITLTDYDESDD